MWQKNGQTYNKLCWICEEEASLKETMLNAMGISIRLMAALKKGDYVRLNGKKATVPEKVKPGDLVEITFPEESSDYLPQKMDLTIHYEDQDLLVIEKPYDLVVHPTRKHLEGTMLNGILYYFQNQGIKAKPRFINRLDRYTSGVLIVAKSQYAHSFMSDKNALWDMDKEYTAVVQGRMTGQGSIRKKIAKSEDGIKREVREDGQEAISHYKVIKSTEEASLVKIRLETGRTHQIRVHMASLGHPLFGDELYGGDLTLIRRQALHSTSLGFYSPRDKEKKNIKIMLPKDIRELVYRLFSLSFDEID